MTAEVPIANLQPPRLQSGDRVAVVTPSWPVRMSPSPDPFGELEAGMEQLRNLGLDPVLAPHALADTGYAAGSAQARADDINEMFADPEIKAIISSHGGHVAAGVLAHLDWDVIAANPTILMGFSNASALLLAIHAVTGMITFHGPMVMWQLGQGPDPYEVEELHAMLFDRRVGPIGQRLPWETVRNSGAAEGTLLGPGMSLRALAGTRYQVPHRRDVVLFFEGMVDAPGIVDSWLRHLIYMGVFDHVRGVLVGSDGSAFTGQAPEVPFTEILLDVAADYEFSVVKCDDFGHGGVNTVLPIGAAVRLDPDTAELVVLEPFLACSSA